MLAPRDRNDVPVVVANQRRALAHLLYEPDQLGLARAWVDGSLGVEGDLDVSWPSPRVRRRRRFSLRIGAAWRSRRSASPDPASCAVRRCRRSRRAGAARRHSPPATARPSAITTTSPTTSTGSCSDRRWSTRAPTSSDPDETLERAQERKLDLICRKLTLAAGQRLLDVGCGWGSLALHAARQLRRQVLGVTLSEPQAQFARERAAELGLERSRRDSRSPTTASCPTGRSTRSPASACSSTSARPS